MLMGIENNNDHFHVACQYRCNGGTNHPVWENLKGENQHCIEAHIDAHRRHTGFHGQNGFRILAGYWSNTD